MATTDRILTVVRLRSRPVARAELVHAVSPGDPNVVDVALGRLVRRGVLKRTGKGWYASSQETVKASWCPHCGGMLP